MNTVKMNFKNSQGKIIEKDIEENLVSLYEHIGWKIKKEDVKKEVKPKEEDAKEDTSEIRNNFSRKN